MRISLNSVRIMKRIILHISLVIIIMVTPIFISDLFSQPIPPTPQGPIDGGLGILAVLGISFLFRKKLLKK